MARIDLRSEILLIDLLDRLTKQGHAILAFEHRLDYMLERAHSVILLDNGKIRIQGSPKEVIQSLIDIDLPEVSMLTLGDTRKYPLSITEAYHILKQDL
jgi:ABC-type cobalamin/Fe3+-siderophores transport system ATPase subunit